MANERRRVSFGSRTPQPIQGLDMELNDQVFKVRPKMSGIALLRVIGSMEGEDEGAAAGAMIDFISRAFLEEDRERGMNYLEFGEPPIELEDLKDIVQYLIGQYTGNFTDPSPSSTSGSASDGSTTTAAPSEMVSTSPNSTPSDSLL
ncbi:tail assembly chaperone [Gordonia phage BlueNGold]|nr:tail assembly chaperone [Gordonia phage BlueNGold]